LADILALRKPGMDIAAIIKMMARTISNSIREKPLCLFISLTYRNSLLQGLLVDS